MRLIGNYTAKVDSKGRLRVPSDLLDQVGKEDVGHFVIKKGLNGCLDFYPENTWDLMMTKLESSLDEFDPEDVNYLRAFLSGHKRMTPDSNCRVKIPLELMEFAGIKSDITFVSMGNRVELWASEKQADVSQVTPQEFDMISRAAAEKRKRIRNGG